jgi:hypothetical protein
MCRWNLPDRDVFDATCGSFEAETQEDNPHFEAYESNPMRAARSAVDLEVNSRSVQLFTTVQKIFGTSATIGCAAILTRGGLCRLTARSAHMVVRAVLI